MAIQRLSGTIKNYTRTRKYADFVFNDSDKTAIGVVAIAAGLAGLSGQAISLASAETNEAADYIEFDLDGKPVKGWVWRSPFREGDAVEIVAEWQDDHYEAYAVARPEDRIVALYPHCSRGARLHVKNAWKWWFWGGTFFFVSLSTFMFYGLTFEKMLEALPYVIGIGGGFFYGFFGLMTYSLTRKWMPFVRLAERVFTAFGWDNPGDIDLVKRSKETREQPYLAPELDPSIYDEIEGEEEEEDSDPNLPDFLRPKSDEELLEEQRRRAQKLPEPARSEELQRIEAILQDYAEHERQAREKDDLERTIKRNAIVDAYGSMYFRY